MHWQEIVAHLEHLSNNDRDQETREKADAMLNFMLDKNALISIAFVLDIQEVLKIESKIYQRKGDSVIGQKKRRDNLLNALETISRDMGGRWTHSLLQDSTCQRFVEEEILDENGAVVIALESVPAGPETVCNTLENFEQQRVRYHNQRLFGDTGGNFQYLSTFIGEFLNKVIEETKKYLPDTVLIQAIHFFFIYLLKKMFLVLIVREHSHMASDFHVGRYLCL